MPPARLLVSAFCLALLLASLQARAAPGARPVPTQLYAATVTGSRLVIVLPGRGGDLDGLRRSGIAAAIQRAWPDADVLLAGLELRHYTDLSATRRVHEDMVTPARRRGVRSIWLVGASLGGTGVLLYERDYPGDVDGLVALAPYLGDARLLASIRDAGGVAHWDPASWRGRPDLAWQADLWRVVARVGADPDRAPALWIGYGRRDPVSDAAPLLASALPPGQLRLRPGDHDWATWLRLVREILGQRDATRSEDRGVVLETSP